MWINSWNEDGWLMAAKRNRLRVVILSEGKRDYDFVRRYLQHRIGKEKIEVTRVDTGPDGQGSGEQRIREHYPAELHTLRTRASKNACLIVMVDGDRHTASQRRQQLEALAPRQDTDVAPIIIPCRNIETWFAWLDGQDVDEQDNYKSQYGKGTKAGKYGERMAQYCAAHDATKALPSIRQACDELNRMPSIK